MLNDLICALENGKKRVDEEKDKIKKLREELKDKISLIKQKKEEYFREYEEKCNNKLLELEKELDEIKKEIAKKEKASIKINKERLSRLKDKYVRTESKKQDKLLIGDYVTIRTLGISGYVTDIDEVRDIVEVITGNVRTKISRVFISKSKELPKKDVYSKIGLTSNNNITPELNIIGFRVEEAISALSKFIDSAVINGVHKAKIIHGIGTGRLMKAVKDYLSDEKFIKHLRSEEGNAGVTVVEFI
jgi:DNA mismatch repair protein MutS2